MFLDRARVFYEKKLGLEEANYLEDRKVSFFWLGPEKRSMLGVWEVGTAPVSTIQHIAFDVTLEECERSIESLKEAGIEPLDFFGRPTDEPVVIGWMPAAMVYFKDPDGHLLEYIAVLDEPPRPAAGIVTLRQWRKSG